MPLDPRLILAGRGVEVPPLDLGQTLGQAATLQRAQQALTLGELGLAKTRREQAQEAAVGEALRGSITTNGQLDIPALRGTFTQTGNLRGLLLLKDLEKAEIDQQMGQANLGKTLAETQELQGKGMTQRASAVKDLATARKQELEALEAVNTLIFQAAGSVGDQATYDRALAYLEQTLPEPYRTKILSETPPTYDPAYVAQVKVMTQRSSEALQAQLKDMELQTAGAQKATGQQLNTEEGLRKELQKLGTDFQQQAEAYGRVQASVQTPSAAGDLSLIFAYMKILDPGSTVREGEQATARNAAGIPDRIRGLYNRVMAGESLAPVQRADFAQRAGLLYQQAERDYAKKEQEYRGLAQRLGARPENVTLDMRSTVAPPGATAPSTQPDRRPRGFVPAVESPYGHLRPEQLTPQQRAEEKAWLQQQLSGGR